MLHRLQFKTVSPGKQSCLRSPAAKAIFFMLFVFLPIFAQSVKPPISKNGLLEALRIGGLKPGELVQQVQQRGVEFELTGLIESELMRAGARPDLIHAVRTNYRPEKAVGVIVPQGTELTLVTTDDISLKSAKPGDSVSFRVEKDIVVNHQVVILKDVAARGRLASSDGAGSGGKGGKLSVVLESTSAADGQKIRLRLSRDTQGDDKGMAGVAIDKIFKVFGFLKIGNDPKIKAGTKIKGYTDEEKRVRIRNN